MAVNTDGQGNSSPLTKADFSILLARTHVWMYRSTLAPDSKHRGVLRMGCPRIQQAVSHTHALGGEEIPAPGVEVPLKSSWRQHWKLGREMSAQAAQA